MLTGGANLVQRQPVFSADGKTLLVCTSCTVSIYNVATGLLVTELHGHTAPITSICVVQYAGAVNSVVSYAWTSSVDGTIKFWDINTGAVVKSINVGRPILSMVVPKLCTPVAGTTPKRRQLVAFLLVQWNQEQHNHELSEGKPLQNGELKKKKKAAKRKDGSNCCLLNCRVILHDLSSDKPLSGHLAMVSAAHPLVVSPLGGLVGLAENWKIWVWRVPKGTVEHSKSVQATSLHHTKVLQALAFDPTETMVAGCDVNGRILIWKNVGDSSFVPPLTQGNTQEKHKKNAMLEMNGGVRCHDDAASLSTYHWHADRVNFLLFSADGTHLFSGGKEAVLVLWHLETSNQQFLPRLGAPLLFIASSPDPSFFSISCADNTIKFVNIGTMSVDKCIQGIKPPVLLPDPATNFELTRIAVEPQSGSIVLPADNLTLQFYDVFYDRHITEVQISPRNYVPTTENTKGASNNSPAGIFVTHLTFSSDGSVMATVELCLSEDGIGGGTCLKFWKKNSIKMQYSLNTQVDEPHSAGVASFVYHPTSHMAVSCSEAGEFKVWVQAEGETQKQATLSLTSWKCQSVGAYQQKPMLCAAFSPDGTLLAVAAEELVTLWNPLTNGLVCVLASSPSLQPIKMLSFAPSSNHLITASWGEKSQLIVWSLETLSIHWSYLLKVEAIAVDPKSAHFAILASSEQTSSNLKGNKRRESAIAVFNMDDPFPNAVWSVRDVIDGILIFLPPVRMEDEKQSRLLFMNQSRHYVLFNPFNADDQFDRSRNSKSSIAKEQGSSAFESIYGKVPAQQIKVNKEISGEKGSQPWGDIFSAPSHVLPPLTRIGFSYLESLLERRTNDAM